MGSLDFLYKRGEHGENLVEAPEREAKKGFMTFTFGEEIVFIRKSSLLWMLDPKTTKVSTDRVRRFHSETMKRSDGCIYIGDFIWMVPDKAGQSSGSAALSLLCQVMGFKYSSGKPNFAASFCPIVAPNENARGVKVLCNLFKVAERSGQNKIERVVTFWDVQMKYIDIIRYKCHAMLMRNLNSNEVLLSD